MRHRTGDTWHVWVRGIAVGQLYGYRIEGPYQPEEGHRFNPHKLLLDPYASAIAGVKDWKVLALSLAFFGTSGGLYAIGFWAPLIVRGLGFSVMNVGFLVAIPNLIAVIGMVLWSRHSDRTGERYWHAAIACLIGAVGMDVAARAGSSATLAITGLSLTAFGVSAAKPPLWSLPTTFFADIAAAASIGLINSLGTLGGFAGPYMIGSTNETSGNFSRGLYLVGGAPIVSALTIVAMRFARKAMLPQDCQTGKVF